MRVSFLFLLFATALFGSTAFAQSPDDSCRAALGWLADTFSANDAGYPAVIERKGEDSYVEMLAGLASQAEKTAHGPECHAVLLDYVAWFRRGHVGVRYTPRESPSAPAPDATNDEDLRARYADAWALDVDVPALRARFEDPPGTPTPEGIWANGTYEIAVVRADTSGAERYLGVVLTSANPRWQPGQVKLELYPQGGPSGEPGTIWMSDHSARVLTAVERIGEGALELRPVDTYTRTAPEVAPDPAAQVYLDDRAAPGPVFRQLSPQTAYLRVPSFDDSQKAVIDSVVAAHHAALASTPGLVIDIRGNGGGADASYARILDYLYTTPIRQVSAELRSTPLNNARNQLLLADPDFPEEIKEWVRDIAARLDASDAEWVPMSDERVVVERRDTVYANPSRVVILTDEGNGSTAEQFLLDARQSFKVKTAGVRTAGVLDVSNVNFVTSPDGRYELAYSLSRSYRVPEMAIDDVGLAPDLYLDASVPRWQWVEYARRLLEGE